MPPTSVPDELWALVEPLLPGHLLRRRSEWKDPPQLLRAAASQWTATPT